MIVDVLENAHRYVALHRGFAQAFEFLGRPDLRELPANTIDGERVYTMVAPARYQSRESWCRKIAKVDALDNSIRFEW